MPAFIHDGEKQSLATAGSWDSTAGLFRNTACVIFTSSPLQPLEKFRASWCLGGIRDTKRLGDPLGSSLWRSQDSNPDLTSLPLHTAFWLTSCLLEMELSRCLAKALQRALFTSARKGEGPQGLCAGCLKTMLLFSHFRVASFIYPLGLH